MIIILNTYINYNVFFQFLSQLLKVLSFLNILLNRMLTIWYVMENLKYYDGC